MTPKGIPAQQPIEGCRTVFLVALSMRIGVKRVQYTAYGVFRGPTLARTALARGLTARSHAVVLPGCRASTAVARCSLHLAGSPSFDVNKHVPAGTGWPLVLPGGCCGSLGPRSLVRRAASTSTNPDGRGGGDDGPSGRSMLQRVNDDMKVHPVSTLTAFLVMREVTFFGAFFVIRYGVGEAARAAPHCCTTGLTVLSGAMQTPRWHFRSLRSRVSRT